MPTFRKHEHLLKPAQFKQVYDRRRSAADDAIIVYGKENGLPYTRVGLSVSRRASGGNRNAVQRNRLRRLFREAFRLVKHELPVGLDLVMIPRSPKEPGLEQLQKGLIKLTRLVQRRLNKDPPAPTPLADGRVS